MSSLIVLRPPAQDRKREPRRAGPALRHQLQVRPDTASSTASSLSGTGEGMGVDPTGASIERVFQRLNELERTGLIGRYAIGGAFAFIYYAEPFETDDLDIFTHIPSPRALIDLSPIHEHFRKLGYPEEGEKILEGVPVQILPAAGPLEEEAIQQAIEITVGQESARVFTAEHAVAIALKTNRPKDRMKILHFQETATIPPNRDRLDSILTRYGLVDRWAKFEESTRE